MWTMEELVDRVRTALTAEYSGAPNGRVRDLPDRRSIRWYSTIGLVDRPLGTRGRNALYGPRHLLQLVAIKRLQAAGRTLAEIQAELGGAPEEALAEIARVPAELLAAESPPAPLPERAPFWKGPAAAPEPPGMTLDWSFPAAADSIPEPADPVPASTDPALASAESVPTPADPALASAESIPSPADPTLASAGPIPASAGPIPASTDPAPASTGSMPAPAGSIRASAKSFSAPAGGLPFGAPPGGPEVPPPPTDPGWPPLARTDALLTGVPLGAGVILLVPGAFHLDHTDRAELATAARPLLDLLASRGLTDRRDS
jgi:hypothetical protein